VTERNPSLLHTEAGLMQRLCSVPNTVTIKTHQHSTLISLTKIGVTMDVLQMYSKSISPG